jgi:hypothetical protein
MVAKEVQEVHATHLSVKTLSTDRDNQGFDDILDRRATNPGPHPMLAAKDTTIANRSMM